MLYNFTADHLLWTLGGDKERPPIKSHAAARNFMNHYWKFHVDEVMMIIT